MGETRGVEMKEGKWRGKELVGIIIFTYTSISIPAKTWLARAGERVEVAHVAFPEQEELSLGVHSLASSEKNT